MIEAKVIADSISEYGKRLTTFQLRYPKFIHGEFMTHRVISRNASSSRAIPTTKLIEEVDDDALRATFVFWGKNQSGMQAAEELTGDTLIGVQNEWRHAARFAATIARRMVILGAHKQLVNRLLEPFSHINVVATATEWDNFFGLRLHKDAQPEMRALAVAMWEARKASEPNQLSPGSWHLPFIMHEDSDPIYHAAACDLSFSDKTLNQRIIDFGIKVSVARCARVSYLSHETGKRSTVEEDLKLYDRLVGTQPLHASPAEHQATPDKPEEDYYASQVRDWACPEEHGNFVGWRQYRKMLVGEACAPLPEDYA